MKNNTIKYVNVTSGNDKAGNIRVSGTISTMSGGYYKNIKSATVVGDKVIFVTKDNQTIEAFSNEDHKLEIARFLAKSLMAKNAVKPIYNNTELNENLPPPPPDFITDQINDMRDGNRTDRKPKKSDKINVPLTREQRVEIEIRICKLFELNKIKNYQHLKGSKPMSDIMQKYGFNQPNIEGRQLSSIINYAIKKNSLMYSP